MFGWLEDWLMGTPGARCAEPGCGRREVDGGFCSGHRDARLLRGQVGLLELNNFRKRFGDAPLSDLDGDSRRKKGGGGSSKGPKEGGAPNPLAFLDGGPLALGDADANSILAMHQAMLMAKKAEAASKQDTERARKADVQKALRELEANFGLRPGSLGPIEAETEEFE